jgi:REP element-mobilizing transposase RayT
VCEVTTRTIQGRFLLRPSEEGRRRIIGIVARAQQLYKVDVHAFVVLSNHWHLLASSQCGEQFASFMCYVNGNMAREMGRLNDWDGPFGGRRARPIACVDDDAAIARLKYCFAQGVKEGLVETPEQWPGASTATALLGDMTLVGTWLDRDKLRLARRAAKLRGETVSETAHTHQVTVQLTPLPQLRNLDSSKLRALHQKLVDEVVAEAAEERNRADTLRVVGVDAVLNENPHSAPQQSKSSPAPLCHTTCQLIRERFRLAYGLFVDCYRKASKQVATLVQAINRTDANDNLLLAEAMHRMPPGSYSAFSWWSRTSASLLANIVRKADE